MCGLHGTRWWLSWSLWKPCVCKHGGGVVSIEGDVEVEERIKDCWKVTRESISQSISGLINICWVFSRRYLSKNSLRITSVQSPVLGTEDGCAGSLIGSFLGSEDHKASLFGRTGQIPLPFLCTLVYAIMWSRSLSTPAQDQKPLPLGWDSPHALESLQTCSQNSAPEGLPGTMSLIHWPVKTSSSEGSPESCLVGS